jgi:hypothetical protein
VTDFGITLKRGDYYNAGSKLTMNEADGSKAKGHKIYDKAARRIIRKTSYSHRKGERSIAVKLDVMRAVRAEANSLSSNSHEARRLFAAELVSRRRDRAEAARGRMQAKEDRSYGIDVSDTETTTRRR